MLRILSSLLLGLMLMCSNAYGQNIKSIQPTLDSIISPDAPFLSKYSVIPIYYAWMIQLATCEKLSLPPITDFKAFRFIAVNATAFHVNNDTSADYLAITVAKEKIIYFSIAHVLNRALVFHEFLHILLYYNFPDGRYTGVDPVIGTMKNHPPKYFLHCGVDNNY